MEEAQKKVSAGGVVVHTSTKKVLLVNRQGLEMTWSLPKGHVDAGEDQLTAAKREILEETGVENLTLFKKLGEYDRYRMSREGGDDMTELKTIVMYLFTTNQTTLAPRDPHNPEARWVDKEEVTTLLTHRRDKEFFLKVKDTF